MRRLGFGLACALLASCSRHPQPPPKRLSAHYVVGPAWRGQDGTWFYPKEDFGYTATGLAFVLPRRSSTSQRTADGEIYDPVRITGSHQTLQLPALVFVTNLDNGRRILVRLNDRGPSTRNRLLGLTPRAAALLGGSSGSVMRVRLDEDDASTRALDETLAGGPSFAIAAAPVMEVRAEALPPPGRTGPAEDATSSLDLASGSGKGPGALLPAVAEPNGQVWQDAIRSTRLWIDAGRFSTSQYADDVAQNVRGMVVKDGSGRTATYLVRVGPFDRVQDADTALDQALAAGVTGARIIVE